MEELRNKRNEDQHHFYLKKKYIFHKGTYKISKWNWILKINNKI